MLSTSSESVAAARGQIESLLLEPMLKPLAGAFGEYGDIAISEFSKALAKQLEQPS